MSEGIWFRIELCEDGSVHTCVPIAGERNGMRLVFFVKAATKEEAIAKLLERRAKRLAGARERAAVYRTVKLASGMCGTCGKRPPYRATMCAECYPKHLKAQKKYRERGKREESSMEELAAKEARAVAIEKVRGQERVERRKANGLSGKHSFWAARAKLLQEVLGEFRSMSRADFEASLEAKIQDCWSRTTQRAIAAE